ncbi:MAG: hypothetical protein WCF36_19015 [Candidatus Nanopelagicales bacterium]
MPTPAAQERARRGQQRLREARKASMVRLVVWLPRTTAADFRALADEVGMTHTDMLDALIRDGRDARPGQSVLD